MKLLHVALLLVAALGVGAPAQAADGVRVTNAWAKATVPGQKVAGVYLEIQSPVDARVTGVSCALAGSAEIHLMKMENGTMKMRPLKVLDLPAGKAVKLEPGGLHVMLFDIGRPLRAGERLPVRLTIEAAGQQTREVAVEALVRGNSEESGGHDHEHH